MVFLVSLIAHFVFILINYNVTSNLKFSQYSHEIFQDKNCVDDFTIKLYSRFIPIMDSARSSVNSAIMFSTLIIVSQFIFLITSYLQINKLNYKEE